MGHTSLARSGVILVFALVFGLSATAYAQSTEDEGWGDDSDAGFADFPDEPTPTGAAATPAPAAPSPWTLTGTWRSDGGAWIERFEAGPKSNPKLPGGKDNPFAKARASLDLQARYKQDWLQGTFAIHGEYDFAYLHRRDEYDTATIKAFETLRDPLLGDAPVQIREAWVAASLGDFEWTTGRQIVAWGEGDGLSPLDVVNPRDMREPGLADLDDIRVPILATRLGWFTGDHRVEAMVTFESHWGFRNPPLGPFSPFPAVMNEVPVMRDLGLVDKLRTENVHFSDTPEGLSPDGWQYLLRWVYKGAGIDLGFYAASVIDRQGVIETFSQTEQAELAQKALSDEEDDVALPLAHRRYAIAGMSGARTFGSFLVKWELAYEHDHPYNAGGFDTLTIETRNQLDVMLGVTYSGLSDTMIGLEASKVTFLDDGGDLLFPIDTTWMMLRISHNAMRETLKLMAVASVIGEKAQYGWLGRLDANYELADGFKVGGAFVTYHPNDDNLSPFSGLDRHDRVMARLRWDFRLL